MAVKRVLLCVGVVATLSACGGPRVFGGAPGEIIKPYNYNCPATGCVPLPTRVVYTVGGSCKVDFQFQDFYVVKGRDVSWQLDLPQGGQLRFKEVRDASGRLTRPGIAIDDLDGFADFENPRYGRTQNEYLWSAKPQSTGHRHRYAIYVEWQPTPGAAWQECATGDPIIVSN